MYKLTDSALVIRISDGARIPSDPGNADRIDYEMWLSLENMPEPADVPLPPTKDQRIAQILATTGKGKDRTLIQQVIAFAEIVAAPMLATQYGVSLEFAIMGLYARNKTYRESKDTELACQAIEGEP